jgi:hypothetical protein
MTDDTVDAQQPTHDSQKAEQAPADQISPPRKTRPTALELAAFMISLIALFLAAAQSWINRDNEKRSLRAYDDPAARQCRP